MKGLVSLKNYLENTNLADNLPLSKTTSFHWSNWQETCVYQQENKKKRK
jgi:hypothetical protein